MKQGSTHILRGVIYVMGFIVLALCLIALPAGISSETSGDFDYGWILLGLYVPVVPFFYALGQALKLLRLIDKNEAFSLAAINTLKKIKLCALIISGLFTVGQPYVFYVADRDDAPGLAMLGFVIIGASFVIATAASLFQKLFQNAVDIKSENDLTV